MGNAGGFVKNNRKRQVKQKVKYELLHECVKVLKDYVRIELIWYRTRSNTLDLILQQERVFHEHIHYLLIQIHHNLVFLKHAAVHVWGKKKAKQRVYRFEEHVGYFGRAPLVAKITVDDESLKHFVENLHADVMECRYLYELEIFKILRLCFPLPVELIMVITTLCCDVMRLREIVMPNFIAMETR